MYEAVGGYHPHVIDSELMLVVAIAGLMANLAGISYCGKIEGEPQRQGAFLHMMGDLLSSIGVIVAAVLIFLFNWTVADPIISIAISLIILYGAARLCRQSAYILLEFTPAHIELSGGPERRREGPRGGGRHDIHAWTIHPACMRGPAHIRVGDQPVSACSCISKAPRTASGERNTKSSIRHFSWSTPVRHGGLLLQGVHEGREGRGQRQGRVIARKPVPPRTMGNRSLPETGSGSEIGEVSSMTLNQGFLNP